MKQILMSLTAIFLLLFTSSVDGAIRIKSPRIKQPKQSYAKQIGGNPGQKTRVEYDRGNKYFSKTINGGTTNFIPKDAKNIRINGMRINQGERVRTSPGGASFFDD